MAETIPDSEIQDLVDSGPNQKASGEHAESQKPKNRPLNYFGWMGMFFAVFCWGLSFPLLKIALDEVEPITLAVLRYTIAIIPLFLFLIVKEDSNRIIKSLKEDFFFFLILGLVGITLPNLFQNYGMTMTSAHLSSIIQASGPIFTIIMAVLILKEPLGANKVIGTVIALSGTLLLVTGGGLSLGDSIFLGNILILMSAISYAFSSIMSKKILEKYDPLTVAIISMLLGTVILAVFSILESPHEKVPSISLYSWNIIVILALFPGSFALLVWYWILRTSELSRIILFIYLIPVFASAISYFWPGEIITLSTVVFAALIICGVAIAQYERRIKNNTEDDLEGI
ncbi:MAG: DMT family transporter [Thermoplasmata archaeon]|nr:MAG: DMT family transporter [Thermoplasmata archaeon]